MKRKMAFLLAVVLIVSAGLMAYATGPDDSAGTVQTASAEQELQDPAVMGLQPVELKGQDEQPAESGQDPGDEQNSAEAGNLQEQPGAEGEEDPSAGEGAATEGTVHNPEVTQEPETSESSEDTGAVSDPDESGATEDPGTAQDPEESEEEQEPGSEQEPDGAGVSQEPGATENPAGSETVEPGTTENPVESETGDPGTTKEPDESETTEPGATEGTDAEEGQESTEESAEPGATEQPGETEEGSESETDQDSEEPEEGDELEEEEQPELPIPEDAGQVDVTIEKALLLNRDAAFNVALINKTDSAVLNLGSIAIAGGNTSGNLHYEDIPDGDYLLRVSAEGYATYEQDFPVYGKVYDVSLTVGFLNMDNYTEGKAHPGVLVIGDVVADGRVDEADKNAMVDAVDQKKTSGPEDLNGDGVVNLVDLEYFARTYQVPESIDMLAYVGESISKKVVQPKVGNDTLVAEGSVESLLENTGSVSLKPRWEGDISAENPVSLRFDLNGTETARTMDGIVIKDSSDNPVENMDVSIVYVDENGEEVTVVTNFGVEQLNLVLEESDVRAERDEDGNIRLSLGDQIAVKRVTLIIKGTRQSNDLVEISKVEFLNDMENRIPAPQMDIPENVVVEAGSALIQMKWDPCVNVTGYEVSVRQEGKEPATIMVVGNELDVTSYGEEEITNYETYFVKVQSVNGTWRSGYGEEFSATPMPTSVPEPPDYVSAAGKYKSLAVSWKDMDDTLSYNVYFKPKESGDDAYQKIEGITQNSYTITGLEDLTDYNVYVTGVNHLGEGGKSLVALATTTDANAAEMLKYKLINVAEPGEISEHIISATGRGSMHDSPHDTDAASKTAWGTVDNNPASYYDSDSWDDGGYNVLAQKGLMYEFDQAYKMDRIAFHDLTSRDGGLFYAHLRYWDEEGNTELLPVSLQRTADAGGHTYYMLKFSKAVKAKKIQFGIGRYSASGTITISEVYFYEYDSLFDDIMALYEDDLHTVLKPEVTQKTIDDLRVRVNTMDPVSGEYHPDREVMEQELKVAEDILNAIGLSQPVRVHSTITGAKDGGKKFGGLNAWQPLGVTAAAGDKIMVYVGHNTKRAGEGTNLQLVATQYNSEATKMSSGGIGLKIGANEITIPKIWSLDYESGGALYVQYTGNNANDQYSVRVSGGVQVPILDLYHVTDDSERLARTKQYVEKLQTYVAQMKDVHEREHYYSNNELMKERAFDNQTCILGASDILLDTMMLSLPAQQIWAGCGGRGTDIESRARTLLQSMDAMEDMMYLFYQHKGLNANAPNDVDKVPACHQNIRYQRMFAGAFMYAAGNHIGIGWGSTSGMVNCGSVVFDEKGRWQSGNYFGWGIGHEIGHCINQGDYAIAEITNNYFAVLAQAHETNDSVRLQYEKVYEKVTSNTVGRASNVFTQLGMYWQLHLAYDDGYNYMTYENYDEQLANLFFARVDTYSRTPSRAPGEVALNLNADSNQKLMRLCCAAAEKNILDFFRRWGMVPDEETEAYAKQFPEETRAIYYINDEARAYRVENKATGSVLGTEGKVDAVGDAITAKVVEGNKVDISLSSKGLPEEDVLGYEIVRGSYEGGVVKKETVGFATGSTCTYRDVVATINNRILFYEVTLVDKYLNRSAVKTLDAVKIEHDGSLDKTFWTVSTKNLTVEGETETGSTNDLQYCDPDKETVYARDKMIDNMSGTVYEATAGSAAEITLDFNRAHTVAGFKITAAEGFKDYEIQVCCEGIWLTVAEGTLKEKSETIHFANSDNKYISTHVATAAKLILKATAGSAISIAELDVLGVTGDNVDFRRTDGDNKDVVIGKLAEDFKFGDKPEDVIPAGSIVFAGSYKGNAAYNSVLLFDQEGRNVGKVVEDENGVQVLADSIIMADVPDTGNIADVRNGTWIYWVDADTDLTGVEKVRAELYRVNKAETQEGQRLVSDSLFETVPKELPSVTLSR